MRIEQKMHRLMCQTGACSLALGIISLVVGVCVGVLGIVNGGRLLKHNGDLL